MLRVLGEYGLSEETKRDTTWGWRRRQLGNITTLCTSCWSRLSAFALGRLDQANGRRRAGECEVLLKCVNTKNEATKNRCWGWRLANPERVCEAETANDLRGDQELQLVHRERETTHADRHETGGKVEGPRVRVRSVGDGGGPDGASQDGSCTWRSATEPWKGQRRKRRTHRRIEPVRRPTERVHSRAGRDEEATWH